VEACGGFAAEMHCTSSIRRRCPNEQTSLDAGALRWRATSTPLTSITPISCSVTAPKTRRESASSWCSTTAQPSGTTRPSAMRTFLADACTGPAKKRTAAGATELPCRRGQAPRRRANRRDQEGGSNSGWYYAYYPASQVVNLLDLRANKKRDTRRSFRQMSRHVEMPGFEPGSEWTHTSDVYVHSRSIHAHSS